MSISGFTYATRTAVIASLLAAVSPAQADAPLLFDSPQASVLAMVFALENRSREDLIAVFGSEAEDLLFTGEQAQDTKVWTSFLESYQSGHILQTLYGKYAILMVGADNWPFPIPLQMTDQGQWFFDAAEGRDEILLRRIGRNELATIETLQNYVDLQTQYRSQDRDGDGLREFASALISTPETHDGLYWPGSDSPAGEFIAQATAEGYVIDGEDFEPQPYGGYIYKMLSNQGPEAPGGAMEYTVNGHQIAGHAMLAHPANYGNSGIMSFMVAENGVVFEADLGEDTDKSAADITGFNPGADWAPVQN